VWKKKRILLTVALMLMISAVALDAYQVFSGTIPGTGTVVSSRGKFSVPNGSLVPTNPNPAFYFNGTGFSGNNTIAFDLLGSENLEPSLGLAYNVTTTGSMTITYLAAQPKKVICGNCIFSYNGKREIITYSGAFSDVLVVVWSSLVGVQEPQSVLFRDDFLYTNPLIESSWTIDQYTNPGTNSGEYTSSGYLVMKATSIATETVHVSSPIYNPASYSTGTAVKRKLTIALIPFAKTEAATANIRVGLSALQTAGAYPSSGPYGTPFVDGNNNCIGNANDPIGTSYMLMDNSGGVIVSTCGDGGNNRVTLETGLNPSLYTVFTVETYGIFCSTCTDNAYTGTTWTWFRAYQEDSTGRILSATDKNLNFTSNIAPLFQTNYAFVSQLNSNAGASGQLTKIDFVQVQNYGSPVCLVAPAGFLCSRLPAVPNNIIGKNGLVGLIAWLANQIGFGDEQAGAIILFIAMFFAAAFVPYFFSRNLPVGAFGAMLTLGFFTYVGFLPIWTLILVFMGGASIAVLLVLRMLSGTSIGSAGGSDS
jgi:hypothetical protein